jgi:hypothetical protein
LPYIDNQTALSYGGVFEWYFESISFSPDVAHCRLAVFQKFILHPTRNILVSTREWVSLVAWNAFRIRTPSEVDWMALLSVSGWNSAPLCFFRCSYDSLLSG